jgi:DNA-binding MarR family transcriptional regulator
MSSPEHQAQVAAIARIVPQWQDAVQAYDERFGERFGLAGSDRRCLSLLAAGPRLAREIAEGIRLTPAAVTALVDRLETRGLVRRLADPADRRRTIVELTEAAQTLAREHYGPIARAGDAFLAGFSAAELALVRRFLEGALELQLAEIDRLDVLTAR